MGLKPKSELSDSEEEKKKYSLKEMSKSTTCALDGIFHFSRKLKSKPVPKEKIDLVNSVISVHGKDSPEIFFFGSVFIRDWFENVYMHEGIDRIVLPAPVIDGLINSAIQSCINTVNFFKARENADSSLVHAPFALLFSLVSRRLCDAPPYGVAEPARRALADLVSADVLRGVSLDAAGIILAACSLLVEIDPLFAKKETAQSCIDIVINCDPTIEAADGESAFASACMYLGVALGVDCECRSWIQQKLLSKPVIVEIVCASLSLRVNNRNFLFLTLRLLALMLHEATSSSQDKQEEGTGLFGTFMSSTSAPSRGRAPELFEGVDIDVLDDIFSAYTDESMQESDSQIVVVISAIGRCLCRYYSGLSTTRATAVFTSVKRWAVSSLTSVDALVVACGLSLTGALHMHSTESVSQIAHSETLKTAFDVLKSSWSYSWAKGEAFAFVQAIAKRPQLDPTEFSDMINVFIHKFKFHYLIMHNVELKELFFKSVSMKEAFGRLVESLVTDTVSYRELVVVSRVMLQMVTAVKAKQSLGDFQLEVKRVEIDRANRKSADGSVIAGFFRSVKVANDNEDFLTAEVLVHLLADLVDGRNDKFNSALSSLISDAEVKSRCDKVLAADSQKPNRLDLQLPDVPLTEVSDCVETFLSRGSVVTEPAAVETDEEPKDASSKQPAAEPDTWMDSAANWFLDVAGDDEEADPPEKPPKEKKKKKKKSVESDDEEVMRKSEDEAVESEVTPERIEVPKAVVKKAAPVAPVSKQPTPSVGPKMVPAKAVAGKGVPAKSVIAKGVPAKGTAAAPVLKKAVVAKPVPKSAPVAEEPPDEPEPKEKKKKKKEEEEVVGGLGDALYAGLGGWFGAVEEKPKKEKKKKKADTDDEEVVPVKAVAKPALKAPSAKAPVGKVPAAKAPGAKAPGAKAPVAKAPIKK